MGIGTISQLADASRIDARHPLCRGEFAAIVFCGDLRLLGELAGEATAHTPWKFVLPDPTLDATHDFARVPGMLLPRWTRPIDGPLDGACFVFTNAEHPSLIALRNAGAKRDEHFVVMAGAHVESASDERVKALDRFARCRRDLPVVILGYGHQGADIANRLRDELDLGERILIHDGNADSRRRAQADGFATLDEASIVNAAIIYSPLMRHDRLHRALSAAAARNLPTFDNSQKTSSLRQFTAKGVVKLDGAARRSLRVDGRRVALAKLALPLRVGGIREDRCRIGGSEFAHLYSGYRFMLDDASAVVDLDRAFVPSPLPADALNELKHVFLAIHDRADRADLGFFAARDLALRLWPNETHAVFPAEHVADLGGTAFERLLHGHLFAREVVSTMQTSAQRVVLGVAARRYAADRPIVEIGSSFGGSAMLMAAATDGDRPPIHSIDPDASTRDIMRFAFEREGHLERLDQIILTSDAAADRLKHLRGKCGLVFIDGLHTYAGVESDFNLYAPLVAPGGALLFHDVVPQIEPVMRFVMGRVVGDARFALKCLVDGLAVFERT